VSVNYGVIFKLFYFVTVNDRNTYEYETEKLFKLICVVSKVECKAHPSFSMSHGYSGSATPK